MAYDPERFRRAYLPEPLPLAASRGWRLTGVGSDRLRSAVDLSLRDEAGRSLFGRIDQRVAAA